MIIRRDPCGILSVAPKSIVPEHFDGPTEDLPADSTMISTHTERTMNSYRLYSGTIQ